MRIALFSVKKIFNSCKINILNDHCNLLQYSISEVFSGSNKSVDLISKKLSNHILYVSLI